MIRIIVIGLLFFTGSLAPAIGQPSMKKYMVKDGKMYISVNRQISDASLDSFITQFSLNDLALKEFMHKNYSDSVIRKGWIIETNNRAGFTISKNLEPLENMDNPANKISYTEKHPTLSEMFPSQSQEIRYGYNRVKKGYPFSIRDSVVTFFLRGHTNARRVTLAGSFNTWSPDALKMTRTDSGWYAKIKLGPGKFWYKYVVDGNWMMDNDNMLMENDGLGNTNSVFFRPNVFLFFRGMTNAKKVFLAGSFNNWRQNEIAMSRTADGWGVPLYLAEGTHTYKFLIDGQWVTDENADEKFPDGHGGFNSVIRIGTPHLFRLKGYTNARQVTLTGSFNNWRPDEILMKKTNNGWEIPYTLGPGNYEYKFKVDNVWITDPANDMQVRNDESSFNSYLIIKPNYTFTLHGFTNAKSVYLAGDLNNWSPDALPMKRNGDGWMISVYLSPGKHRYKFVADGKWILDPGNKLWEQNEYSTGNSIIWVEK
jgi:hypothetical protein